MELTQINTKLGKSKDTYTLLAFPSDTLKDKINAIQEELRKDIVEGFWAMPRDALHITLCEIFQDKEYSEDITILYDRNFSSYDKATDTVLSGLKPIEIIFDRVVVSPYAITIQGTDDGGFNRIRKELVENLPLPNGTKQPPSVIHSTIARFTKEMPVSELDRVISKYSIRETEVVKEFRLVNCRITPLADYSVIRSYPLLY